MRYGPASGPPPRDATGKSLMYTPAPVVSTAAGQIASRIVPSVKIQAHQKEKNKGRKIFE
jgi:hypothetical protein